MAEITKTAQLGNTGLPKHIAGFTNELITNVIEARTIKHLLD